VAGETTLTGRLWRVCLWLIAEAKSRNRLTEVTAVLLHLIEQLRTGQPLTTTAPEPPVSDGSSTPWYVQVRAATSDRRDDVA
jgi:hypothetical protein